MIIQSIKDHLYRISFVEKAAAVFHDRQLQSTRAKLRNAWPAVKRTSSTNSQDVILSFLDTLDRYEQAIRSTNRTAFKEALADDAAQLNQYVADWFTIRPPDVQDDLRKALYDRDPMFLNRSLFGKTPILVISHNFCPSLDPAAFVCTKRLKDMQAAFDGGASWEVISQNMLPETKTDHQFEHLYGQFCYTKQTVIEGISSNHERIAVEWGNRVFEMIKDKEYPIMYSHAWFAASHVAASLYKHAHPSTLWIAENGDPLFIAPDGKPLPKTEEYSGEEEYLNTFWHDIEATSLREADVVIFNNPNQRELMLAKTRDRAAAEHAASSSVIMPNCTIDRRFTDIVEAPISLDDSRINVAYLGSVAPTRPFEPLDRVLDNEGVELYLFLAMAWTITPALDKLPEQARKRVHICEPVTHLEALSICAKIDYCLVNDTIFPYDPNPYQPSKYFDYIAAGAPIIAFTQPGSAIDTDSYKNLQCAHSAEEMHELALGLCKREH